jgi:Secretion system C-terminal sorting domain
MKTLYIHLLALLLLSFRGHAQLTLTKAANEPVAGDTRSVVAFDSTTAVPKSTGLNTTWNFTSFASPTWTETTTYTNVASVPGSSLFTGANLAASRGGNNFEFFKSAGNNFEFMGNYDNVSGEFLILSNTAVFYVWPVSFGSSFVDVGSGIQSVPPSTAVLTGTLSYTATGAGTVVLPGGITHNNCLQVIQKLVASIGTGSTATVLNQTTYQYFSSLKKFPIAEIQYTQESSLAGVFDDFGAYFEVSGTIVGLNQNLEENTPLLLYPVPASNLLTIELPAAETIEQIEVYDFSGRLLLSCGQSKFIDVSSLPESCYLVKIRSNKGNYKRILPILRH